MDVHGRLFLIPSFVASFALCAGSKLVDPLDKLPLDSYFRLSSDAVVLILHLIYLISSRDSHLVQPDNSYQLVLDMLGSPLASMYAHVQFLSSIVGNHYMSVCASDILLEYLTVLLQQHFQLDRSWRRWVALATTCLLTAVNCYSIDWTTATFAIYMKSLFMSFWMAKIWINYPLILATVVRNQQDFIILLGLTVVLVTLLIAAKELNCFQRDVVSANQTVLLPLYEQLVGITSPELAIIVACYYAGSLNSFFLSPDPFIKAAQTGQLPFALALYHVRTCSPIVLLLIKSLITAVAVGYLKDDLDLLGSSWNCLLVSSAILFDIALLKANYEKLDCFFKRGKLQTASMVLLHAGFQLATVGWIYHRLTGFAEIGKTLLFIAAVTIVVFRMVQSEPFVEICCNRLKLECNVRLGECEVQAKPTTAGKDCHDDCLV